MPKIGFRERVQIEHEHIAIRLRTGDPSYINDGWRSDHHITTPHEDTYMLKALRVDAICEQQPAFSFAALLAGLRAEVVVGEKGFGTMTFSRGIFKPQALSEDEVDEQEKPVDLPHMQHGIIGPLGKDIYIAARQNYSVLLTYSGPRVPVSFLRVVDLGMSTRDLPDVKVNA